MKNWIIILLIFIMPLSLYAYLDAKAQNAKVCAIVGNEEVKNPKAKIVKFSSPMCSECKEMTIELDKAMKNYKDSVIVEEINVVENVGKGVKYNKAAIKKYNVSLVPTIVFLDKQGNTIKKREGLVKSDEIIEILDGIK
ncbi:MAG: thioredoxin family protein [Candidatus Gastranaerophilales bacterium]|nr:thioredoxin family protein [Candidatus Gastranaerophilales bacterium]